MSQLQGKKPLQAEWESQQKKGPGNGPVLLQSHNKTSADELFLMDEQRKQSKLYLKKFIPGEDVENYVEMTTDLTITSSQLVKAVIDRV